MNNNSMCNPSPGVWQLKVIPFNCKAGMKRVKYLMSRDNWKSEQHTNKKYDYVNTLLLWLMMVVGFGWSARQQCQENVRFTKKLMVFSKYSRKYRHQTDTL